MIENCRRGLSMVGRTPRGALLAVFGFALATMVCAAGQRKSDGTMPAYRNILDDKAEYHGPERGEPEPTNVEEVSIGFFAPSDSGHPVGRNMWRGATLAVEKANREGGFRGKRFRLECRWADNPWGAGSREMTRLVYEDKAWAVIGSVDGASTHIAEQVAARARIALVSPLSGDSSLTQTAVPWMFRLPPDDRSVAEALARIAAEEMKSRRIVVLSSSDHDGRAGAVEIISALTRWRIPPVMHLNFDVSQKDFSQQLTRISSARAEGIFLWGSPDACVRLLRALREGGGNQPLFAPPAVCLPSCLDGAGGAAEGVISCRLAWESDTDRWQKFAKEFQARFGEEPGDDAVLGYDAAIILTEAIRKAGLNRARIRDAVAGMSGFAGVAGKVVWDNGGGNRATPQAGRVHHGGLREFDE